jgi:hypothetical protein
MFHGQAEQDKFVVTMLNKKTNGFFIELGSSHPVCYNNSFILETVYNWEGIMIEYDSIWAMEYKKSRLNSIHLFGDAQNINYNPLFTPFLI